MQVLDRIWSRVTATQPQPELRLVLLTGALAAVVVLLPATWPRVRLALTVVHEAGHAGVAVLVGRRLRGVRLHADTSGLTVSQGRASGPGMVAMLASGYLAPAALGVLAALLLAGGHAAALLWLIVLLLAALLVWVRNGFGLVAVLIAGVGLGLLTWYAAPRVLSVAAYLIAWILLLGAPRPLVELLRGGRRRGSDTDQLGRLTHLPPVLWALLLLVASLAGLVVGVATLAPDLVRHHG